MFARPRNRALVRRACAVLLALAAGGCAFGPRALERTHGRYNEAVKQVTQEELLLNLVRLRYNDNAARLDVSAIATQYELAASAEARPFFSTEATGNLFMDFSEVLPFAGVNGSNRPTISLDPLDDPETVRSLFTLSTLDGIIFLSETSFPVSTVFRLFVEYLNRLPNAVAASGPPRGLATEFAEFQRVAWLLQTLKDRGDLRFVREEKSTELSGPLPEAGITPAALVEAAKSGFEYRRNPDKTWVLIKRDRRLELKINPPAVSGPEVQELCGLLRLRPGLLRYEVTVGGPEDPFSPAAPPEGAASINIYPRSTVQALFYAAHGVLVPPEHLNCGLVRPTLAADGSAFDWQQVTAGLFTVHSVRSICRPKNAFVAVRYRDYWFYIDDGDTDSKITFALLSVMTRVNLLGVRKGGPALTLPVGR